MFCNVRAERDGRGPRRIAAAGLLALVALAASAQASLAQEQDNIFKQGAKLLGFATDVAPPADFVTHSRPAGDPDYIPVFRPPPEPALPALQGISLKAVKSELDAVQKRHDALRAAYPPAAKAIAEEEAAAKKKSQTNAPGAKQ
jgi:MYXO-CTERM domain-containing protein